MKRAIIAYGVRGGKIVGYSHGHPVYQGSAEAVRLGMEPRHHISVPITPKKAPSVPQVAEAPKGWPQTKGMVTVHSPGDQAPPGWGPYPGPGYSATVKYKGAAYHVRFKAGEGGAFGGEIKLPDGSVHLFASPNQAANMVQLHAKGHPVDLNAYAVKKLGIAYPAGRLFKFAEFGMAGVSEKSPAEKVDISAETSAPDWDRTPERRITAPAQIDPEARYTLWGMIEGGTRADPQTRWVHERTFLGMSFQGEGGKADYVTDKPLSHGGMAVFPAGYDPNTKKQGPVPYTGFQGLSPENANVNLADLATQADQVPAEPTVLTFDQYSAQRGVPVTPPSFPESHRAPGGVSEATARSKSRQIQEAMDAWQEDRDRMRREFDALVARGNVREPTAEERLAATAAGTGAAAEAAQRVLDKRAARAAAEPTVAGTKIPLSDRAKSALEIYALDSFHQEASDGADAEELGMVEGAQQVAAMVSGNVLTIPPGMPAAAVEKVADRLVEASNSADADEETGITGRGAATSLSTLAAKVRVHAREAASAPEAPVPLAYRYGVKLRPPSTWTLPPGVKWDLAARGTHASSAFPGRPELPVSTKFSHGEIITETPLTAEQLEHFDLEPVGAPPEAPTPPTTTFTRVPADQALFNGAKAGTVLHTAANVPLTFTGKLDEDGDHVWEAPDGAEHPWWALKDYGMQEEVPVAPTPSNL